MDPPTSVLVIAHLAAIERLPAAIMRFAATRRGELWAALVGDFKPGDRARKRRGKLSLHRNPKNESSKRVVPLCWELNDFIVEVLDDRYGPSWRTDSAIRRQRLVGKASKSTFYTGLHEAILSVDPALIRDVNGKPRVPRDFRKFCNTDLTRQAAGKVHRQGLARSAYLGHSLNSGVDGASRTNTKYYTKKLWEHMVAAAKGLDKVLKADGVRIDFSDFDDRLRSEWMTRPEMEERLQAAGVGAYRLRRDGLLQDYPLPRPLRQQNSHRLGFRRSEVLAFLETLEAPEGAVTASEGAHMINRSVPEFNHLARLHNWKVWTHPITGKNWYDKTKIECYLDELQVKAYEIRTQDAVVLLGLDRWAVGRLAKEHRWIIRQHPGPGQENLLDRGMVCAYAGMGALVGPGPDDLSGSITTAAGRENCEKPPGDEVSTATEAVDQPQSGVLMTVPASSYGPVRTGVEAPGNETAA